MTNKPVSKYVFTIICSLLFGIIIALFVLYFHFFIHEGGHLFFIYSSNLLNGDIPQTKLIWTEFPFHQIGLNLSIPQRTEIIEGGKNLIVPFGGTIVTIFISSLIGYILYRYTQRKYYFILPIIFLFYELLGNTLCGTDNLNGSPFSICNNTYISFLSYIFVGKFIFVLIAFLFLGSIFFKKSMIEQP